MKKTFSWILFYIATLFAGRQLLVAEEWKSSELNCQITFPEGVAWKKVNATPGAVKIAVRNTDNKETLSLIVVDSPNEKLDKKYIEGFDEGHFPKGKATKVSAESIKIDGVPAYRSTGFVKTNNHVIWITTTVAIANGKSYVISAIRIDNKPLDDPEMLGAINSFHFLKGSKAASQVSFLQAGVDLSSRGIGRLTFYVLAGLLILWGIVKILRKR